MENTNKKKLIIASAYGQTDKKVEKKLIIASTYGQTDKKVGYMERTFEAIKMQNEHIFEFETLLTIAIEVVEQYVEDYNINASMAMTVFNQHSVELMEQFTDLVGDDPSGYFIHEDDTIDKLEKFGIRNVLSSLDEYVGEFTGTNGYDEYVTDPTTLATLIFTDYAITYADTIVYEAIDYVITEQNFDRTNR